MAFLVVPVTVVINSAAGAANADIKVLGTSNVHNWSMEDKDVTCTAMKAKISENIVFAASSSTV